jgi:hypothetical protein
MTETPHPLLRPISEDLLALTVRRAQHWSFGDAQRIRSWCTELVAAHHAAPGGLTLEVGTWKGGTALVFAEILELLYHARSRPMLWTIDPYGEKPYDGGDLPAGAAKPALFGDTEYVTSKTLLAPYPFHQHSYFPSLTMLQNMRGKTYWWRGQSRRVGDYTFVLLDGEHSLDAIREELTAVLGEMKTGGRVVIDNIDNDPRVLPWLHDESKWTFWKPTFHSSNALPGQQWCVLTQNSD